MEALKAHEAAYIAGFIDGEGTINVLRTAQRFLVEMSVGQIDRRPLLYLQEKMGGTICSRAPNPEKRRRRLWIYKLAAGGRFDFYVPQLLPHLILKKKKAEIALELRARLRCAEIKTGVRMSFKIERVNDEDVIVEDRLKFSIPPEEFALRMEIVRRAAEEQARWGLPRA